MADIQIKGKTATIINQETVPTAPNKNNGSYIYTYDVSGNLTQIDLTIGAATYRRTLGYDVNNNLTSMSVWVAI